MPSYKNILPRSLLELQELRALGPGRLVVEAITTGLVSGLVIGCSRLAYTHVNQRLSSLYLEAEPSAAKFALCALFIALCAALAYWCVRREALVAGSGIPQVELALRGRLPMPWLKILCYKFAGTLASMCGCLSLGRGAPSIQMGAAIGCGVGRLWHEDGMRPRFLVGGAVAGLTACFGAPWAGILFAFEELRAFATLPLLLFMGLTSCSAWCTTDLLLGLGLVFPLPLPQDQWEHVWLVPACGLLCAPLCWLYNAAVASLTKLADQFLGLRARFCLAFGLGFVLLMILPCVIDGLAPTLHDLAAQSSLSLRFLCALWLAKLVFNIVSGSSNAPGGLLMPLLTAGGFTGALCAGLLELTPWAVPAGIPIALCMTAFFSGIVRAPLTAAFLVAETTGLWTALPSLAAVSFITAFSANALGVQPIFTCMRMRQLRLMRQAARRA